VILYLVTDRRQLSDAADWTAARECLLTQARHAVHAGIDFVQIRERDLEAGDLAELVGDVVALARGTRTRVLVNDRVDVAMAAGAAGVHLRADSVPAAAVRAIAPASFVVGQSVHSTAEAAAAAPSVDYLIAGTVWPSSGKPSGHPVLGIEGLSAIARAVKVPVFAIGGVTPARAEEIAATGAAGLAAIGLFMGSAGSDRAKSCRAVPLEEVARAVRARFDTSAAAP
jgi:thiamine-phosphate diphosphorylase